MDQLIYLFAAGALLTGLMAGITVWAPRRLAVKVASLGLAVAILPLSYASMAALLSKPKPMSLEWARSATTDASVLGASVREGQGSYLLLELPNAEEPRYYVLPWSEQAAQQLQQAQREAEDSGADLGMRLPDEPFEKGIAEGEPMFYPKPQPAPPPKDYGPPPLQYHHPQREA